MGKTNVSPPFARKVAGLATFVAVLTTLVARPATFSETPVRFQPIPHSVFGMVHVDFCAV